ncbi:MAG TPA: hypothetical protein VN538_00045 [Clostridia bacterium]|nr:hypothetical protein [Clostridia bacterium]
MSTMTVAIKGQRRGRPRRVESFSEWMAKLDSQVEATYQKVAKRLPVERLLSPAQRRIVEMLVEHLRSLPEIAPTENTYNKPEYKHVNSILTRLFQAKYPQWTAKTKDGSYDVGAIPNGESSTFYWLLRNCAGRAPEEAADTACDDAD